jgi:hypothetical protein
MVKWKERLMIQSRVGLIVLCLLCSLYCMCYVRFWVRLMYSLPSKRGISGNIILLLN